MQSVRHSTICVGVWHIESLLAAYSSCQSRAGRARASVIVVDASALLEVLLNTPSSERVSERLFRRNETLHAPHLLDLEVAQVLRRYTPARQMDAERSEQALEDLTDLPLNRYPPTTFSCIESGRSGAT